MEWPNIAWVRMDPASARQSTGKPDAIQRLNECTFILEEWQSKKQLGLNKISSRCGACIKEASPLVSTPDLNGKYRAPLPSF